MGSPRQRGFRNRVELRKLDAYLRGRKCSVVTDHASLKRMLEAREGRVARWACTLTEHDLDIIHKSGKLIEHVDYFTRFVDLDAEFNLESRMVCSAGFLAANRETVPTVAEVIEAPKEEKAPRGAGYQHREGTVFYHGKLWVTPSMRNKVIGSCHSVAPYRHQGIKKTEGVIWRVFGLPSRHKDIVRFLVGCLPCQRIRIGAGKLQGLMRHHPLPGPFHTVYVDHWECEYNGFARGVNYDRSPYKMGRMRACGCPECATNSKSISYNR
eukprot:GHVN01085574.1.p1 GENE.GHVN01085574.1~~GHVN01085574.1.p1  ORF type:complete len:268 (-),score=11.48 GHVN01085574.1:299-1102(-)